MHYRVFESSAEQAIEFTMCAEFHTGKVQHLLSFEILEERQVWHYCVFKGPAEQNIACAVCFQHPAQHSIHFVVDVESSTEQKSY